MPLRPLAAAALLAAAGPVLAEEAGAVQARALLHTRVTAQQGEPRLEPRFDASTLAFQVGDYFTPAPAERHGSLFLAADLSGRTGPWRWALGFDSGELRRTPSPPFASICLSRPAQPTGLALADGGACAGALLGREVVVQVPSAGRDTTRLTAGGRAPREELRQTLFVREAWVGITTGRNDFAFLRAGRHRFSVADGLVYDDYGLGLEARLDLGALGPSWEVHGAAFLPTRDWPDAGTARSPLLFLRLDRMLSLFDHVGAFAAYFHDDAGEVASLFRGSAVEVSSLRLQGLTPAPSTVQPGGVVPSAYQQEARTLAAALGGPVDGTADLVWGGLSAGLSFGRGHRVSAAAAVVAGTVRFTVPLAFEASVLGWAASAAYEVRVHRDLLLGARFLFLSGDAPPEEKVRFSLPHRYGGFVGVAPWITATNLFFKGGLSETFAARQASAPGVNGRGVLGPVLRALWEPAESFQAELRGAWLEAPVTGPFGGRVYGPEVDVNLRWSPLAWLSLSLEADQLWSGSFYGPDRAPVRKLILGVDLTAP
ncbi:MAG: hypothetical protein HZB56_13490 [Deltaproteobacteria bacterium]|nr:hypothetical protein [Deltaproteobacteria bacterium]